MHVFDTVSRDGWINSGSSEGALPEKD